MTDRAATPVRPAEAANRIDDIRWLIEAARAACRDPDGPPINGMCVLLDVIDDKLSALCDAVDPQADA